MKEAAETCIAKILKIDFNQLDISYYNREYIQRIIPHIRYYFKIYIQAFSLLCSFRPEKNLIVDFGGGHGFLSLFLKSLGYRVIYCDANPWSVKTVSAIKEEIGLGPDYIVTGSVSELKQFCLDNHLKPDYLIATDLIEHIYDLQDFFLQLKQINPDFEMMFTTGSNPQNFYKCRKLRQYMTIEENYYFDIRRSFIMSKVLHLTETETTTLAQLTRGKIEPDILKILDSYKKNGQFPPPPDDPFNTCDPETGNWTERILPLATYSQFASKAGFQATFARGFYNEERNRKVVSYIFRMINFYIRKSGKFGFVVAPYILIRLLPKHG